MGIADKLAIEAIEHGAETAAGKAIISASKHLAEEFVDTFAAPLTGKAQQRALPERLLERFEPANISSKDGSDLASHQPALEVLAQQLGQQSDAFQRLISMKNVDLAELARLLKDHGDAERKALTEMIEHGATEQHLLARNVQVLAHLNSLLHLNPEATAHLMKFSPQTLTMIEDLPRYLAGHTDSIPAAKKLIETGRNPETITGTYLFHRHIVSNHFYGEDSADMARITELEPDGLDLTKLSTQLYRHGRQLKTLLQSNAGAEQFSIDQLELRNALMRAFPSQPEIVERAVAFDKEGVNAFGLALAVENKSLSPELVDELFKSGRTAKEMNEEIWRQYGLQSLRKHLGESDPIIERLLKLEPQGAAIQEAGQMFEEIAHQKKWMRVPDDLMARARALVDELANTKPAAIRKEYLEVRLGLQEEFKDDDKSLKMLLKLEDEGLNLVGLHRFMNDLEKGMVKRLLHGGASAAQLSPQRLESISRLETVYGPGSATAERLQRLEFSAQLPDIVKFASESAENKHLIGQLAGSSQDPIDFNVANLRDRNGLNQLNHYFGADSDVMSYLTKLQRQSLPATRLANFIKEASESRKPLVEILVAEQASVERFKDHMTLSVLPDDVAYRLVKQAESGEIKIPRVLQHLKDWQSGPHYLNLVTEHVRSGSSLSELSLIELDHQAKQIAELAATPKAGQSASGAEWLRGVEKQEVPANVPQSDLNPVAKALLDTAQRLNAIIPAERTIVLLGRDAEPLLPVLRNLRSNVQYFLWSRLQENDARTAAQWLKEVPPNAAVIDTGHYGNVLKTIRGIDNSVSGYLMHSSTKYPQLLPESKDVVNELERLPKLTGRAGSYTDSGGAITRQGYRDINDKDTQEVVPLRRGLALHRWEVENQKRQLLQSIGLPRWDVWRYSTDYVGLTAKERLAVSTNEQVEQHYEMVARERAKTR